MVKRHWRRPDSDVIHVKRGTGEHRATYEPENGRLTYGAHGVGHDVVMVGKGWTRKDVVEALAAYDFRCCEVAA